MFDLTRFHQRKRSMVHHFPCESRAFPVSRQKHCSAHIVLHHPSTGRGSRFHRSAMQGRRTLRARAGARLRHFPFFAFTTSLKLNKKLMNNTLGVKAADRFNLHP